MDNRASISGQVQQLVDYRPGLHLILDAYGLSPGGLKDLSGFSALIDEHVNRLELVRVGAVHHAFPDAGFTSVICLTESHISVHTWPEFGRLTFDVFLSNYSRDNSRAAEALGKAVKDWFGKGVWNEHRFER